jgi:hypothetical protein
MPEFDLLERDLNSSFAIEKTFLIYNDFRKSENKKSVFEL